MELTRDVVEYLILNGENDLKSAAGFRFVDTPGAIRRHSYSEMNEKLITFLDKLVLSVNPVKPKVRTKSETA